MKMRTTLRAVAATAFCCAAVCSSLWGCARSSCALPVGAGGYLDASFFIVEGIAFLVFGAQAASMVRPASADPLNVGRAFRSSLLPRLLRRRTAPSLT